MCQEATVIFLLPRSSPGGLQAFGHVFHGAEISTLAKMKVILLRVSTLTLMSYGHIGRAVYLGSLCEDFALEMPSSIGKS